MRWVKRSTFALVVGLLASVLMAWACALWSPVTQCGQWEATEAAPEESPVGIPPEWMGQRWEGHHAVHTTGYRECRGFGLVAGELIVSEWVPHPVLEDRPLQDYHVLHTVRCQRAGWPMGALQGEARADWNGSALHLRPS